MQTITTIGLDIAKSVFQVHGVDAKGLGADSEEKREPVSDIDTEAVDSLKVLDPNRPIQRSGHPSSSLERLTALR
jgi:hypothetical protein